MLTGLHVLLLRVADVEIEREFYQNVLNLELLASPRALGKLAHLRVPGIEYPGQSSYSGTLEIIAGGVKQPVPTDRIHSATTPVLQVQDVNECLRRAVEFGGTVVNEPWDTEQKDENVPEQRGVRLAYFADPEGHVIGLRSPLHN